MNKRGLIKKLALMAMTAGTVFCMTGCGGKKADTAATLLSEVELTAYAHVVNADDAEPSPTPEPTTTTAASESDKVTDDLLGTVDEDGYIYTKDKVYINATTLNFRSGPSTDADKIYTASTNEVFIRISKGPDGWDKIEYNGEIVYAFSEYLKPVETESSTEEVTE